MRSQSESSVWPTGAAGTVRWRLIALVLLLAGLATTAPGAPTPADEYILVSGGPALRVWEDLRPESHQHDQWWGNFVRAARIRMEQLRAQYGNAVNITWLVYRPGYSKRSREDGRSLEELIHSVRDKFGTRLVWIDSGDDIVNYLNGGRDRRVVKISGFEYFGHSNRHCFMLDYSCDIMGASTAWLHEDELHRIRRGLFKPDAHVQSYGCHTGESMSAKWLRATGVRMIGAMGKTDYSDIWKGTLPHINQGYWKR